MNSVKAYNEIFLKAACNKKLDVHIIHDYLANQSEWSKGIPPERVMQSIESSLNFSRLKNLLIESSVSNAAI